MLRAAPQEIGTAIKQVGEFRGFIFNGNATTFEKKAGRLTSRCIWGGCTGVVLIGLLGLAQRYFIDLDSVKTIINMAGLLAALVVVVGLVAGICCGVATWIRAWKERNQVLQAECEHDLANVEKLIGLGPEAVDGAIQWLQFRIEREEGRIFQFFSPIKFVWAIVAGVGGLSALNEMATHLPHWAQSSMSQLMNSSPVLLPLLGAPVGILLGALLSKISLNRQKRQLAFLKFAKAMHDEQNPKTRVPMFIASIAAQVMPMTAMALGPLGKDETRRILPDPSVLGRIRDPATTERSRPSKFLLTADLTERSTE